MPSCKHCGVEPLQVDAEGNCGGCGVDPFLVEMVGEGRALASALAGRSGDVARFVDDLATLLEDGFASHTDVKRSLFGRRVKALKVELRQHVYHLVVDGKGAKARRARHVRGIRLKEEDLALAAWLDALAADLAAVAAESHDARQALARFVK